jgi:epoxyqueuosine reductase
MKEDLDFGALADELVAAGRAEGLDAVAVTSAEPFAEALATLRARKAEGLHGGMAFTYRNPERSTDPARTVPDARALIVGARSYLRDTAAPATDIAPHRAGVVARYSWEDYYEPLRESLERLADRVRAEGYRATVLVDDNALVDRAAAHRAGLGWFGKNANLLLPGAGSWFVLGSVVTDAPLPARAAEPSPAAQPTGCGSCDRCLPACPTGALVAPGVLDARRCLAWLIEAPGVFPREFREALGARIYGCDDCQEACPPNRIELRRTRRLEPASPVAEASVDVVADILEASDDVALLDRFGRWYIAERKARYLRRNALVVLGNIGDGWDERTHRAVGAALRDDDPIVRAHAVWAAARIGDFDADLAALARQETDPTVLAELGDLPSPRSA